ncbi:hypothetical protein FDP41_007496 [Naegleria fowleri]|uniref:TLC domain-containing protein n=1 Tax=Naegleria fowleri TaxID=5763 RepID=A0A6A5CG96_NAEFO|nr:uncharacterized protein FDP41_007496 [Naegleria fowleri]KAF0984319.1 hypothetical protein FDP41_007496 [Naegleria fowleri]CAG4707729.1 unnamed protein product [Naegleria fowleri]
MQKNVHPSWTEDYSICLVTFLNSILFHTMIYLVLSPLLSRHFKSYREGDEETKIEWNSRVVSNVHAILYVLLSCYSIFVENAFPNLSIDEATKMSRVAVLYAGGYFFYDLILIIRYPKLGGIAMLFHHGFVLVGIICIWFCDKYWVVLCYYSILEVSTPFVNGRWFLMCCGLKDSVYYWMNNLLVWLVFGLCRMPFVIFGPYLIYVNNTRMFAHNTFFAIFLYIQIANISILNIYWYSLMSKKLVQTASSMLKGKKE